MGAVASIKEALCVCRQPDASSSIPISEDGDQQRSPPSYEPAKDVEYELPDGTTVKVAGPWREAAPEALFAGSDDAPALPRLVAEAVGMCDRDLQPDLCGNVVLSGGATMLPGFCARVQAELERAMPDARCRAVPGPKGVGNPEERGYTSQRKHAAWIGGSMLASLETFDQIKVTKQEWEDQEDVIHRKSW